MTMRIQDKGRPLHADAQFKIRPRIFLEGNFFVDVSPGTAGKEVADNHTFPVQQTDTPVQLDEVLTALQTDTREDLKTLLREYAAGLRGKGAEPTPRSSTGSRPTATRRSSPRRCWARRSTTSPATSTAAAW